MFVDDTRCSENAMPVGILPIHPDPYRNVRLENQRYLEAFVLRSGRCEHGFPSKADVFGLGMHA